MPVSIIRAHDYSASVVRQALNQGFRLLGMDVENPFRDIIKPGETVFIKPNWCNSKYRASCFYQGDVFSTITHPALIRAVAEKVDIALQGKGEIIIGDNPTIDADFDELMAIQNLEDLKRDLQASVQILDLRPVFCDELRYYGQKDKMKTQRGDPLGEATVGLGNQSQFHGKDFKRFHGVFDDDKKETRMAHSNGMHLYSISRSILRSDVFISLPKLKTHHKTGVTLNLKGLVGIVGNKNYLVHWRDGFPGIGGDAYPNMLSWIKNKFKRVKNRGAWSGNDTIWRMVVDLYSCMQIWFEKEKTFSIVDGILGGEGNGPFCVTPKHSKTLIMGDNLLEVDIAAARLMGFTVEHIKHLNHYLENGLVKEDIEIHSAIPDIFNNSNKHLAFEHPKGWECLT